MKTTIVAALALAASLTAAMAEQRYDRKLEAAAISIAASKMGELRGGFGVDARPVFVSPIDRSQPTHLSAARMDATPTGSVRIASRCTPF
ncbi:hypothetical protein [Mesorhizobium australicum]|uniref:Uncharacterized protein n=1 Tax=Mesorhizobium australicum TaxID=536018 RepID=A0A1X7NT52_9HYPH|nr:hypothetical protein [Mesorhizobium australicum]SMH41339.1 hypothetical protein SAMN02982922_2540 [Mesorhizobium australicum]